MSGIGTAALPPRAAGYAPAELEDAMAEAMPAIEVVDGLLERGAEVRVYDPAAMDACRDQWPSVRFCEDAYAAAEAFIASATTLVTPIIQLDDHPIGDGAPGPYVRRMRELYLKRACSDPHITDFDYTSAIHGNPSPPRAG